MMLELKNGRPDDISSRLEKEIKCYDFLENLNIKYSRVDHEAADTMEICEEIDKTLGAMICKNLFLCNRQQTAFYLLMIPADKVFKTKDISAQIGSSRLSFATAEHMEKYLDITPGSVSILGLMNDTEGKVKLIIDDELINTEYIGCHPCINTSSLKIKTKDLLGRVLDSMEHTYTPVTLERYTM